MLLITLELKQEKVCNHLNCIKYNGQIDFKKISNVCITTTTATTATTFASANQLTGLVEHQAMVQGVIGLNPGHRIEPWSHQPTSFVKSLEMVEFQAGLEINEKIQL